MDAAQGGMLGVSTFFTLSGFLIAGIVLDEWTAQGRLSLRHFWERRARRLLSAVFVTLAGIVVMQYLWEVGSGPLFRGDR